MSKEREEKFHRLPKWARFYIENLEADLAHHKRKLRDMVREEQEGDADRGPPIIMDPYDEKPIRLPRGSNIVFLLEEGDDQYKVSSVVCRVQKMSKTGPWVLVLRACDGQIVVRPAANNTIHVKSKRMGALGDF